jgi:hypothetical protein
MSLPDIIGQGLVISIISIILSIAALSFSLQDAQRSRVNSNSWETYQAYNSDAVRRGRELARKVMHDTHQNGFATYEEYRKYFNINEDKPDDQQSSQRQWLHDLAAFYHQTGVLLHQGRLDRDFTLLMVGPGLEERWPVVQSISRLYEKDAPDGDFPYGGMYVLYKAYLKWKSANFVRLRRQFINARQATVEKSKKSKAR